MCCDDSICGLNFGRGYTVEKCNLDTLFFKGKITNGQGNLNTDYFGSRIIEDETDTQVRQLHQKVLDFYRFRSESLHEGDGSNITGSELHELENITREVLKRCLARCKSEFSSNPSITWCEIKNMIMNGLIAQVTLLQNRGVYEDSVEGKLSI